MALRVQARCVARVQTRLLWKPIHGYDSELDLRCRPCGLALDLSGGSAQAW